MWPRFVSTGGHVEAAGCQGVERDSSPHADPEGRLGSHWAPDSLPPRDGLGLSVWNEQSSDLRKLVYSGAHQGHIPVSFRSLPPLLQPLLPPLTTDLGTSMWWRPQSSDSVRTTCPQTSSLVFLVPSATLLISWLWPSESLPSTLSTPHPHPCTHTLRPPFCHQTSPGTSPGGPHSHAPCTCQGVQALASALWAQSLTGLL